MAATAELEIVLSQAADGQAAVRMHFTRPGSAVESTFSAQAAFDFASLRALLPTPDAYGQALAASLFSGSEAQKALVLARGIAAEHRQPLRLRINIDDAAPELHRLRWETLTDPEQARAEAQPAQSAPPAFLCQDENFLFSRFLSSASTQPFIPTERANLRALVVISGPKNADRYGFAPVARSEELERARCGLADLERVELAEPGQATLENIRDQLRTASNGAAANGAAAIDVLYMAAHGARDTDGRHYLLLEDAGGNANPTYVEDFVASLGKLPLLAVLVSCVSAGESQDPDENPYLALGPRLAARGVPAVLAMQGNFSFDTAAAFLPVFFRELMADGALDRALAVARWQVRQADDWWMPVLFSRLRDNQLFLPPIIAQPLELAYFEPETIYIPAGKFILGRDTGSDVLPEETPRHEVDLPAFRIGKFPVTNAQFAEFISQTSENIGKEAGWKGFKPPADQLNHPVQGIPWEQAMRYCQWLSQKTGRSYTLPTEAQWEKAARGAQGWLYPWGDVWLEERCNPDSAQVTPVDHYPPQTPYGCYDMVGNIREWTLTRWGTRVAQPDYRYPWRDDDRNNPTGLALRVIRGGAMDEPDYMTVTARSGQDPRQPGLVNERVGFRVVLLEMEVS